MRIRKNVKDLSLADKQAFLHAVLALKKKPGTLHPHHSRYDDYVETHREAVRAQRCAPNAPDFQPGWAHNAPAFLPWHRMLLVAFEADLAAIDANVTLPYWDWTDPESNPLTADFLGGNGDRQDDGKVKDGPFAIDGSPRWTLNVTDGATAPSYLQRDLADAQSLAIALPTANHVADVLKTTPYEKAPYRGSDGGFRARLEIELHNLVNRWIGGTMVTATSPNDPVFFLHHANTDRLWAQWQDAHPGVEPYLPESAASAGHNLHDTLIFSADGSAPFGGPPTPAGVLDHRALGYAYNTCPAPDPRRQCYTASALKALYRITYDAPGAWVDTRGHIHHGGGGPGDPVWAKLSPAVRDDLTGRAIIELAALTSNREVHAQIARAASALVIKP